MSDSFVSGSTEAEEISAEQARSAIEDGRAAEYTDRLLEQLAGEDSWRREGILDFLMHFAEADAFLPVLHTGISDARSPARRNAARTALARLASPGSRSRHAAMRSLERLLGEEEDVDVRLLAATAMGEAGNGRFRPALETALADPEANVRSAAAEALGSLGDPRALPALARAFSANEFWTRAAILTAFGQLADPHALPILAEAVLDPLLSTSAVHALGRIGDPAALELLRAPLQQKGELRRESLHAISRIYGMHPGLEIPDWLRSALGESEQELIDRAIDEDDAGAVRLLGVAATPGAVAVLMDLLRDPDRNPVASAALMAVPPARRCAAILAALPDADSDVRTALLELLPPLEEDTALQIVMEMLGDPAAETRAAAAEALRRSDPDRVLAALLPVLEQRPSLRLGAALALARLGQERCEPLLRLLADSQPEVRAAAAEGLAHCGPEEIPRLLGRLEREEERSVRAALIAALGRIGGSQPIELLDGLLRNESPAIRYAAAEALGSTGRAEAIEVLERALTDPTREVRIAALHSVGEIGGGRVAEIAAPYLSQPDREVRRSAVRALGLAGRPESMPHLLGALEDVDREVRLAAVDALCRMGGNAALHGIESRLEDEADPEVRGVLAQAWLQLRSATGAADS